MYLLLVLCLLPIVYEDFRYRAIHWIWLVLFAGVLLIGGPVESKTILSNFVFIGLQLFLLTLYFSIKHRKWINITKDYLGIGDILFFIPLCLLFSPDGLILFFVGSLLLSLIGTLLFVLLKKTSLSTIPLAGCMSIPLIIILCTAFTYNIDLRASFLFG